MTRVEKLKEFAVKHPMITMISFGLYGIILGACLVRDLYHYNIIKK